MAKLEYTMTNDILFKMYFVKHPDYLKRLVGMILKTPLDAITEFVINNSEIPPQDIEDKFCRLDINMTVNGQKIDLEIQVEDKKDYPERSLYYWAREYSSALKSGGKYKELPRVIIINIVAFTLFDCKEYHSEFRPLEVNRHTELCDKQVMHYYELPKLPDPADGDEEIKYWLAFFKAETEEDLDRIIETGVPFMSEAVAAYQSVARSNEFKEYERMREKARHNEASAIGYAVDVKVAEIAERLRKAGMSEDFIKDTVMS